jgi:hypothetical protein
LKNKIPYFILFILFLSQNSIQAQQIELSTSKTLIKKNEHFYIRFQFSHNAKKEFQLYRKYKFPDLVDVVKLNTYFEETDESYTITQWYKPLKAGDIVYPSIKIEDRHHKNYFLPSTTFHVKPESTPHPFNISTEKGWGKNNQELDLPNINLEVDVSHTKIIKGQALSIHYFIMIPSDNVEEFSFINFQKQQEELKQQINPNNEVMIDYSQYSNSMIDTIKLNDKSYYRYHLLRCVLFPKKSFRINKLRYQYIGYTKSYDSDLGVLRREQLQYLESNEKTITVIPSSESNVYAVGNFEIKILSLSKQVNKFNPIECILQIKGDGNVTQMANLHVYAPFKIQSKEIISNRILSFSPYSAEVRIKIKLSQSQTGKYNLSHYLYFPFWNAYSNTQDSISTNAWINISDNEITDETQSILDEPFYKRFLKMENQYYIENKDQDFMNSLVNLLILVMFVITAILVIKK